MSPWSVPLLCFAVNYFVLLAFVDLNWDRYYLPTVIADRALVAAGIYEAGTECWRRLPTACHVLSDCAVDGLRERHIIRLRA